MSQNENHHKKIKGGGEGRERKGKEVREGKKGEESKTI